jgi:hypothetical protein
VWDLSLFGQRGKLDFTGISQHWARETTKRRADMEAFLQRLAYLHSTGQISGDVRVRTCREVRHALTQALADGTAPPPGGPAGEDGEGFAIRLGHIPAKTAPGERGLPGPRRRRRPVLV